LVLPRDLNENVKVPSPKLKEERRERTEFLDRVKVSLFGKRSES